MTADEVLRAITGGFGPKPVPFTIEALSSGYARTRTPFDPALMLRPGNVVSGPTLFAAADLAMYVVVLGHIGPQLMAVTSEVSIHFLSKGRPGDIISEASLLKLGRKLAVIEVRLRCGDDPTLVAHATGSYALPSAG
jgi:uncharacterized protein (TIGR00369 family)